MYKYLLLFTFGAPLLGIIFMEGGTHGWSIGIDGHPNGASIAYAGYAIVVLFFAYLSGMRWKSRVVFPDTQPSKLLAQYTRYIGGVLLVECILLVILLFGFDGIRVWTGEVQKGTFRINLGVFGSFAFLITKFLIPGLLAYGACLYIRVDRKGTNRFLWWAACSMAFACGSMWGYKSTSMHVLLPSLLIIFWHITLKQVMALGLAILVSFAGFFLWFDVEYSEVSVLDYLWHRATVLQGDVAWLVWEKFIGGETFPSYAPTLLPVVGDNLFTAITGIERVQFAMWTEYHYDHMLNSMIAGRPYFASEEGGSITGTIFSEGLIAGGIPGLLFFGALAGILVGLIFRALSRAITEGRIVRVALLSTYFCWAVFPWMIGGGIIQLFHIATVAGMLMTNLAIVILSGSPIRNVRRATRFKHSWLPQRH